MRPSFQNTFLGTLLLLAALSLFSQPHFENLSLSNPRRPFRVSSKVSASEEKTVYILYSTYGQLNNQVVSLVNALLLARNRNATLVLPYTQLGRESMADAALIGEEPSTRRQLVGDYFDLDILRAAHDVITPGEFFSSPAAVEMLSGANLSVPKRAERYYHRLFASAAVDNPLLPRTLIVTNETLKPRRLNNVCDFSLAYQLHTQYGVGMHGRFALLPSMFRRHNLNCTAMVPDWIGVRRAVVPRAEVRGAVETYRAKLIGPVLAIHLRVFINDDVGHFTAGSFVAMLYEKFAEEMDSAKTVFLAYSPSSQESCAVFDALKHRFAGQVVDSRDFAESFKDDERGVAKLVLTRVLFDMWMCVHSDVFLGRLGSSLSWNVVFWRQALWGQLQLEERVVAKPIWYELANFSTDGTSRKEGSVRGSGM